VPNPQSLIDKIKALSSELHHEVEAFVDFIASRAQERSLARAAAPTSAAVFCQRLEQSQRRRLRWAL